MSLASTSRAAATAVAAMAAVTVAATAGAVAAPPGPLPTTLYTRHPAVGRCRCGYPPSRGYPAAVRPPRPTRWLVVVVAVATSVWWVGAAVWPSASPAVQTPCGRRCRGTVRGDVVDGAAVATTRPAAGGDDRSYSDRGGGGRRGSRAGRPDGAAPAALTAARARRQGAPRQPPSRGRCVPRRVQAARWLVARLWCVHRLVHACGREPAPTPRPRCLR